MKHYKIRSAMRAKDGTLYRPGKAVPVKDEHVEEFGWDEREDKEPVGEDKPQAEVREQPRGQNQPQGEGQNQPQANPTQPAEGGEEGAEEA